EFDAGDRKGAFHEDLKWRFKYKIPPGYSDAKKPDGGAGDLLIWKTVLKEGKHQQKDFIFVTAEEKPDCWVRNDGATFTPRLELLEEYRAFTGGYTVHIIQLSQLLRLFEVADEVLNIVRNVEEANTTAAAIGIPGSEYIAFRAEIAPEQAQKLKEMRVEI